MFHWNRAATADTAADAPRLAELSQESSHPQQSSVERWTGDGISITVEQPPQGFWNSISLWAKVPLPPEEVFDILVDPENHRTFKAIKKLTNRKVVSDDGHGRQEVSVTQVGRWRFGPFKGTFTVNLAVTQDRKHGTVDFKLVPAHGGFMKNFTGSWTVAPYNEDSLDELVRYPGRHWGPIHGFKKAIHHLEEAVGVKHPEGSLVQLRQCVAPSILPPPPFDKMLRKITTAQVRLVMEDLLAEAERRNAERRQKGGSGDPQALESHVRKLQ